jgi:hypothetical protein
MLISGYTTRVSNRLLAVIERLFALLAYLSGALISVS